MEPNKFKEVKGLSNEDLIAVCFIISADRPSAVFSFLGNTVVDLSGTSETSFKETVVDLSGTSETSFKEISVKQYKDLKESYPHNIFTKKVMGRMKAESVDEQVNSAVVAIKEENDMLKEEAGKHTEVMISKDTIIANLKEANEKAEIEITRLLGVISSLKNEEIEQTRIASNKSMGRPEASEIEVPPPASNNTEGREERFAEIKKAYPGGPGFNQLNKLCNANGRVNNKEKTGTTELINYILDAQDDGSWKQEL